MDDCSCSPLDRIVFHLLHNVYSVLPCKIHVRKFSELKTVDVTSFQNKNNIKCYNGKSLFNNYVENYIYLHCMQINRYMVATLGMIDLAQLFGSFVLFTIKKCDFKQLVIFHIFVAVMSSCVRMSLIINLIHIYSYIL